MYLSPAFQTSSSLSFKNCFVLVCPPPLKHPTASLSKKLLVMKYLTSFLCPFLKERQKVARRTNQKQGGWRPTPYDDYGAGSVGDRLPVLTSLPVPPNTFFDHGQGPDGRERKEGEKREKREEKEGEKRGRRGGSRPSSYPQHSRGCRNARR
jgi:hypothetical protein